MTIPYGKWLASDHDEYGWDSSASWDTKEQAIAGGPGELDLEPGQSYFVGRCDKPDVSPCAARLIEMMTEADDASEDWAEFWLTDVSKSERDDFQAKIDAAIEAWFAAHPKHAPKWFVVTHSSEHGGSDVRVPEA